MVGSHRPTRVNFLGAAVVCHCCHVAVGLEAAAVGGTRCCTALLAASHTGSFTLVRWRRRV